ncbi:uncharacterized protein J7T54_000330 [Emericellopsis cladophorae]|uniref:DUF2423 domain-containing protein n=1 Tax=Emericellopsis cladophorae TaxID=2686198 RepID=A0A9P9XWL3_9HYPO|nr:uncharacterized protein J7T54_000330 [Emericellopsis cladophorae]KAI6779184.1 hypothetical protein J7T54_000330 [Emericellopsis cladophorae]
MARSSRSSAKKFNNQRKAAEIFGPVESARAERLSQRLLDLAKQPKPETSDVDMNVEEAAEDKTSADKAQDINENAMEVEASSKPSSSRVSKRGGIVKKRQKKSKIVFPKYTDRVGNKKKASK